MTRAMLLCLCLFTAACLPEASGERAANLPAPTATCRLECPGVLATSWTGEVGEGTTAEELTANCRADLVEAGCPAPRCDCEVR